MSMTIEQQPAFKGMPAGTDWIFTVSSTNVSGNYKFKFIVDIQIGLGVHSGLTNTIRLKFSPNAIGVGIINVSDILSDYVDFDLLAFENATYKSKFKGAAASANNRIPIHLIDAVSLVSNANNNINFDFGEEYSTTPFGAPTIYPIQQSSDGWQMYNAVSYNNEQSFASGNYGINPADWNNKNYVLDGTTGTALTNAPILSQYIGDNEYATLAHLNGWTGAAVCQAERVQIKMYDISNTLLSTQVYAYVTGNGAYNGTGDTAFTGSRKNLQYIGVGPANIKGNTSLSIPTNWNYYTVSFINASGTDKSKTYKYIRRDEDCKGFEKIRLAWINKFGVYDYYTFTKKSINNTKIARNIYSSVKGNWGGTTFSKDGADRGRGVLTTKAYKSININTDWIYTDEEAAWLEELFISPAVFILGDYDSADTGDVDYGNYMTPVVIKNTDYQQYTRVNDKVAQYNIEIEYSIDTKVQKS